MFDPTQLMIIVDAVLNYSEKPGICGHATFPAHLDGILDVCQKELEARGYQFEGTEVYTVATR